MTSSYGLPRYVHHFLRQLESYKDYLQWNITEGSHKITLTLTWNFRKNKGKESLWDKMQRTLKISRSVNDQPSIPEDLSRFLDSSPSPRIKCQQRQGSTGAAAAGTGRFMPFGRQLSWSRLSTFSLPARLRHLHGGGGGGGGGGRASSNRASFRESASTSFQPGTPTQSCSLPMSPSRYSWPGAAAATGGSVSGAGPDGTLPPLDLSVSEPMQHSTPVTSSTPNSTRSDISPCRPHSASHFKITYRTEEDIERSLEDIISKTRDRAMEELETIRKEWNESMRNWPQTVLHDDIAGLNTSTDSSETEPANIKVVNETVQKCFDSCDKILDRHSTLIT